jgi:antitoxin (DNA-binding transcriptional repressor) of toxin-antitoxin stability system
MKASVVDLRDRMKEILDALARGEDVTVLYQGEERARLVPLDKARKAGPDPEDDPAFGMWGDDSEKADVEGYVRRLREERFRDL